MTKRELCCMLHLLCWTVWLLAASAFIASWCCCHVLMGSGLMAAALINWFCSLTLEASWNHLFSIPFDCKTEVISNNILRTDDGGLCGSGSKLHVNALTIHSEYFRGIQIANIWTPPDLWHLSTLWRSDKLRREAGHKLGGFNDGWGIGPKWS